MYMSFVIVDMNKEWRGQTNYNIKLSFQWYDEKEGKTGSKWHKIYQKMSFLQIF